MTTSYETTARGIITLGSFVLLCKGNGQGFWTLPGGHVERGEHPAEALKREMCEETGREVSSLAYLTTLQNHFEKRGVHVEEEMWLYRATLTPILKEDPPQAREEHLEYAWAPVVEVSLWQVMPPAVIPFIQLVGGG